jgi:hypothetical protein
LLQLRFAVGRTGRLLNQTAVRLISRLHRTLPSRTCE